MLEKIKLKNSTIALIGIIVICSGIFLGMYEYFKEKKDNAFSEMNILLYESETPENIEVDDEKKPDIDKEQEPDDGNKEEQTPNQSQGYTYDFIGVLEIPKINLKRGFLDVNSRYNNVDYNITVIRGSTMPDTVNNNLILASHSGYCDICFFHNLYKLGKGDMAYIYYKNVKYAYKIVNIYEVQKDGTVAVSRDGSKNCLTLITCTRNSNTKQTVYILELTSKNNY